MKRIKQWFVATMACSMLLLGSVQALAVYVELPETEDLKTMQIYFDQKRSVGKHIMEKIIQEQSNVLLDSSDFIAYLYWDRMGSLSKEIQRYNLDLKIDREKSDAIDELIGRKTPRYILEISDKNGLPGAIFYKIKESSFYPDTTVDLYSLSKDDTKQDLLMTDIPVDKDGNLLIEIQNAGRYLLVGKTNKSATNPFDYERPQLFSIEELVGEDEFFQIEK